MLFHSFKFVYAGNYVDQKELGKCIFQSRKTSEYLLFHQGSKKKKRGAIHVICEIENILERLALRFSMMCKI